MTRILTRASLLCAAALLGGCAPSSRSALQGTSYYGAPAPYAGGVVIAPAGILPRALTPAQPGLASGVDAPPVVAPGSSMAGPRFGDLLGAGPAIDVRERRHSNGATQDIVYRAPATASGENKLTVAVMETSYKGGDGDALKLSRPSLADIEGEIRAAFPAGAMAIADEGAENASGVFGYAHGRIGGETCLYAWQFIAPAARRSLVDDLAGLEGYDVSVRLRFCGRGSVRDLVELMRTLHLHPERLRGSQGLFAAAPAGAVPPGTTDPALQPADAAGIGAQPAQLLAVPAGYVPVLLPGQTAPVLMLRPALLAPGVGRAIPAREPRLRTAARPTTPPRRSSDDAVERAAPTAPPVYRGVQVRTVRSAGHRTAAPGRAFIPLPMGPAPAMSARPVASPPASAGLGDLPMPR